MKILIVGDVYSKLGRATFERQLKEIKENEKINFVIVNGENTSHGKGMNENHYKWYMTLGVNCITLGNHAFNNRQIYNYIDNVNNIVRPLNIDDSHGKGYQTINYNGIKITILQVLGNTFMSENYTSIYDKVDEVLNTTSSDIYICDIHAEATSEKIAFGYNYDGRIDIIYGTHTHVQTNDARILPNGTAYITDVGMTGSFDGVIGVKKEIIIDRMVNNIKRQFEPKDDGLSQFNAIIVEINDSTHKVTKIDTIHIVK